MSNEAHLVFFGSRTSFYVIWLLTTVRQCLCTVASSSRLVIALVTQSTTQVLLFSLQRLGFGIAIAMARAGAARAAGIGLAFGGRREGLAIIGEQPYGLSLLESTLPS
jgi:hypothetical protein